MKKDCSMRVLGFSLLFLLGAGILPASAQIVFRPVADGVPITLPYTRYDSALRDSLEIDMLRFYIGSLELLQGGQVVHRLRRNYFLVDADKPASLHIDLPAGLHYDSIRFGLGVDSLTSVSGVFPDDLDPVNGMYWTWQSGYINFKMEGSSAKLSTVNGRFQFHVGGYLPPYDTYRILQLPSGKNGVAVVQVDLGALIDRINLSKNPVLMTPGKKAVEFADTLKEHFRVVE